jgi:hypothetical protein
VIKTKIVLTRAGAKCDIFRLGRPRLIAYISEIPAVNRGDAMTTVPDHIRADKIDLSSLASDEGLATARRLAAEFCALNERIEETEEYLGTLKERRLELQHREIPDFFASIGVDKIGVPDAKADVVTGPYYKANIAADWPADRREAAFGWLEANGHSSLVNVVVSVSFRRGEHGEAQQLAELIRTTFPGANEHPVKLESSVPWGTLTAFVKEQTEAGESLPLDILGATVGQVAKIKRRTK